MAVQKNLEIFEKARPMLLGLAYRILGTVADSEDCVQETFLKWMQVDDEKIKNPNAWFTTVCTRKCLDFLKSADHKRVDYVGEWLPEPVQTDSKPNVEEQMELASSLKVAFLLMLERLSPKERAAYLLCEIFENDYASVSETLEIKESACRKLVSRAKGHIQKGKLRHRTSNDQQLKLLSAFQEAVQSGVTSNLEGFLADDISFVADHGGKAAAVLNVLKGVPEITKFITDGLHMYWIDYEWSETEINGLHGFMLKENGKAVASVSFDFDPAGQISEIFVMRNPDKLQNLGAVSIH